MFSSFLTTFRRPIAIFLMLCVLLATYSDFKGGPGLYYVALFSLPLALLLLVSIVRALVLDFTSAEKLTMKAKVKNNIATLALLIQMQLSASIMANENLKALRFWLEATSVICVLCALSSFMFSLDLAKAVTLQESKKKEKLGITTHALAATFVLILVSSLIHLVLIW